jgi:O-antigen/teichoic acid export membrane protein
MVAALLLQRGFTAAKRPQASPDAQYESRDWILRALPLLLMGSMFLVNSNADILMLGTLAGSEAAGLYKAASRGAELVVFSLMAVNVPLGPAMARLYAAGDTVLLQRTVTRWARMAFAPAAALAAMFVVWGAWFLGLFGAGFVKDEAYTALVVLSAAQLINVGTGPVGLLLIMTKNERLAALGVSIAAISNIVLNALLIPHWGLPGAAVATAVSTVAWNIALVFLVFRRLNLNPTVVSVDKLNSLTQRPS